VPVARPLRIEYAGAVYHVTSRGNAHEPIYRDDDHHQAFLDVLESVVGRYGWLCDTYCLMDTLIDTAPSVDVLGQSRRKVLDHDPTGR